MTGAPLSTLQLKIGGMSCSFCANSIEGALRREKGVADVHVSLAHEEALIRFSPETIDESRITRTLRDLGFTIRDPRKVHAFEEQREAIGRERLDLASAAVGAVVLFASMAAMWLDLWQMRDWHVWTAWGLATYVHGWNGRRIARMAWGAARRGIANQHVLLSVGVVGAYMGGLLGAPVPFLDWYGFVGFPAVDFFGIVVFLTAYHLLSGWVSLLVRTKASESVRKLLDLQPPTARLVRDGDEREIPIEEVAVGDQVCIRPGERLPVDGRVIDGESAVDESIVTGESIPVEKSAGSNVIGGSINQTGALLVEVTRIGEDSFLRQVARHVEEAKAMKPGIVVLVDRVLRVYVPVVLGIALAAALFWSFAPQGWTEQPHWVTAIYAAVTVLVMGYPCALGMATPLALTRGGGMAAERGILIRSGEAFQILKDVTHVVLDKTGTITEGKPRVVEIIAFPPYGRETALRFAAAAEFPSEHPLGRAIVDAAEGHGIAVPDCDGFQSATGAGVRALVEGRHVLVGSARFLQEEGVVIASAEHALADQQTRAHTAIVVAIDDEVACVLGIADTLRSDAAGAVSDIRARGLVPVLVTGDNPRTAAAVARLAGIEEVHAEILPRQKAEIVRELQRGGARVAMVGDGVNDAPALMQADVGRASGAGADIAIESSDVVFIGSRLGAVTDAISIGAASYRKTVQNLSLAFFFNGIGVPLATTGLVHPSWAMIAMALSVSTVLLNSFVGRILKPIASASHNAGLEQAVLTVPGIHCSACVETIEAYLMTAPGIGAVTGDFKQKEIVVSYDSDAIGLEKITRMINEIGYLVA